jgi:hypothetical protein
MIVQGAMLADGCAHVAFVGNLRLRPGRREKYPRDPIFEVVDRALEGGVDLTLAECHDRVLSWLEYENKLVPKKTTLMKIIRPRYIKALGAKNS